MYFLIAMVLALQPPVQAPTPQVPAPAPATTQPRRVAPAAASVQIRVTDRSGTPLANVRVSADGPSHRSGATEPDGTLMFRTMTPGTYRVLAEDDGFISLEKEIAVKGGAQSTDFSLSAAPAPPPPPPAPAPAPVAAAPPPPAAPKLVAGEATMLSIPDLAERSLGGKDPVRTMTIGCSGDSRAQLFVIRESIMATATADADEMLYLVAGEATLTVGAKQQAIVPGWFSLVPRGTAHTIARRGKNPAIVLSVVAGQPCGQSAAR